MNNQYQICSNCVLDTSEPSLIFDEKGICQYCIRSFQFENLNPLKNSNRSALLTDKINLIKNEGKNKEYDCIIGLSGGVDSSYVAYLVKKVYGLRPLAVHLDNGWNDELAVANIEGICKKLDIDLYTYVINWNEFKDLQLSFLHACVANAEAPTDHAIFATLFNLAVKYKVKYIIDGVNSATEFQRRGTIAGGYRYDDLKQIKGIHKIFGKVPLKTYPMLSIYKKFFLTKLLKTEQFSILNFIDFNKNKAKEFLKKELDWKEYGAKHHESLFTKWHQVVYLPFKFKFDKRRTHLSDLILSNQIKREDAIKELQEPALEEAKVKELVDYVKKKLSLSNEDYQKILTSAPRSYKDYPNDEFILGLFLKAKTWF